MTIIGQVTIPDFVITGFNGSSQITASGLPLDGSVTMAFLVNDPGVWDLGGYDRQLIVFNGGTGGNGGAETRPLGHNGGGTSSKYPPYGWAFVG